MPVQQVKREPKCKICRSEHREELDALLELRARRERTAAGKLVTIPDVCARMTELGMENPTRENVNLHWKKHCALVDTVYEATAGEQRVLQAITAELGEGWEHRVLRRDEVLRVLFSFESKDLLNRMIKGDALQGAQVERLIKMGAELGRQGGRDAVDDLMDALGESAEEGS